jgi:hypothetical protein
MISDYISQSEDKNLKRFFQGIENLPFYQETYAKIQGISPGF